MQYASKVSACRRELNSHQAAWPHSPAGIEATPRLRGNAPQKRREDKASHGSSSHDAGTEVHKAERRGTTRAIRSAVALRTLRFSVSWLGRLGEQWRGCSRSCGRRLQDTDLHSLVRGAGRSCGAPPGVTGCLGRSAAWAQHTRRCLTLQSTGPTTAGQLGPAGGTRCIFANQAKPSYRSGQVSSNVRPHTNRP